MGILDKFKKILNEKSSNIDVTFTTNIVVNNKRLENNTNISKEIKENYRKTIFLYAESRATRVKNRKDYVGYLTYECEITNPDIYHKKLIEEGYYEEAKISEILTNFKVSELKDIIEMNGLSSKGKKEDLINFIVENIADEKILDSSEKFYSLSDKGKEFLKSNQNYVKLHQYKDYQITLEDYYKATKNDKYIRNFNDIAWQIFNERTLTYQKNEEYTSLRYNYFNMANLLKREEKNEHALQLYLYCLVIDLSGIESINDIKSYKSEWCTKKEFLERIEYNCLIPSLINQLVELKDYYDENMLKEAYSLIYLPFNVSPIEYISSLINDAFNTAVFDIEKYKKILIDNKKKKYLQMN
jgi:hypothetical protein